MASITTRVGKGSPLTMQELDANFTNLNADKLEKSGESAAFADLTLSAVSATLHRSPNAITALFVYDTSKDSDGGAWTEKCQHTSWYNETIYGKWLGAQASEAAARAVTGATTDDYFQRTTDGKFYALNAGSGVTEVFRGNKRSFPKVAAIVADGNYGAMVIYDLTQAGCPMWMVLRANSTGFLVSGSNYVFPRTIAAVSGKIIVGLNDQYYGGLVVFDFARDTFSKTYQFWAGSWGDKSGVRQPPTTFQYGTGSVYPSVAHGKVNQVAMTLLPDAPIDPVTGLKVPTIAAATDGGVSVITHSGTVRNSSRTAAFAQVTLTPQLLSAGSADAVWYYAANPGSLGAGFALSTKNAATATDFNVGNTTLLKAKDRANYARTSGAVVQLLRNNEGTLGKGIAAKLSDTYNTGWMVGDIRRAYLASNQAGSVTGPELVTNGTFDVDTTGWLTTTTDVVAESVSGQLKVTNNGAGWVYQAITVTPGVPHSLSGYFLKTNGGQFNVGNSIGGTTYIQGANSATYTNLVFTPTQSTIYISLGDQSGGGSVNIYDNISVKEVIPDRSYKAAASNIYGTLTATEVNTDNDLVAYSGFSAANYLQEPYSAGLDFGTGEWSVGAWVNTSNRPVGGNLFTHSNDFSNAAWTKTGCNITQQGDGSWLFVPANGVTGTANAVSRVGVYVNGKDYYCGSVEVKAAGLRYFVFGPFYQTELNRYGHIFDTQTGVWTRTSSETGAQTYITALADGWYRLSWTITPFDSAYAHFYIRACAGGTYADRASVVGDGVNGFYIRNAKYERGTAPTAYVATTASNVVTTGAVVDRAHSSGPLVSLRMDTFGRLVATAFDGTTTRTVTTSAAYNTATWLKADATYTTDGALKLRVNGVEVAAATGTPLLTLNNSNAVLTIGNSYALDAPFPGSIALLKLSATVPTAEQAAFMYEQEKHLFSAGAKCVLPASTSVLDLAYDDRTDTWSTLQATHEASWSGLVRTSTQAPSAGSFSKSAAGSGIKLLARTTTNPGVDVQMPKRNLKEDRLADLVDDNIVVFDFDAVTSQTDFALPMGYTAKVVYSAGAQKREGSTKDWTRLYDGFLETIRFGTAPGNGVWVQIHAVKEVSL